MTNGHVTSAAALLVAALSVAHAADYPAKPVRIIVPFSAGAAADAVTRVVARKLTDYWGKQVLLDNRPGVPGIQVAANAPWDVFVRRIVRSVGSSEKHHG